MRIAIGLLCVVGACASPAAVPPTAPPLTTPPAPSTPSSSTPPPAPLALLPPLDTLASRAPSLAPGMREVARDTLSTAAPPFTRLLVRADAADTCTRVALAATLPVHAWLTDARGDVLSDVLSASDAAIGPHGPVCVRKGDSVTLHLEAGGAWWAARYVAWASP